jgi:signal transduction histidine kinase
VVYENKGLYRSAKNRYEKALNHENLYQENPKLYAMVLDNLAYVKLKSGDTARLPEMFYNALKIRDSIKHYDGISINKLHLSEYFLSSKDTINALKYGFEALDLSKRKNNNRDYLSSLLLLSKADVSNSSEHMSTYIKLNDSLQKQERGIRNKFARIRFETDEYISETERLNQRVLRISLISFGVLLVLVLLYIIKDQRSKNRVIKIKQVANQEIYNLILAQQKNFEEGREKEKQHISRELHDGILGKLFGVRLSLDSLNDDDHKDIKKKRYDYIEEIQAIAEEIRLISHKLNKSSIIDVDFKIVVEELIKKQHQAIQLKVDTSIGWDDIGNDIKINFYRIIQEAINNIQKHSKATEVKVEIRKSGNKLILQVRDNGIGFNTGKQKNGIGLKNMKTRSQDINGSFFINSNSKGTLIEVTVNIKKL